MSFAPIHFRRCRLLCGALLCFALVVVGSASWAEVRGAGVRRFSFEYAVVIPSTGQLATGSVNEDGTASEESERVTVFLPIASDGVGQRILDVEIESEVPGRIEEEPLQGNRYWRAEIPARRESEMEITIRYEVERSIVRSGDDRGSAEEAAQYLGANERVVVAHPVLDPILAEIRATSPAAGPAERARAIYDWVVDNVEYKKVGTGWGNGDTFWACSERYGNCTDFHSLFISLARTEKIPARFEMGFPIPLDRSEGEIGGYHCWVEFWLPEIGWIPIDASEAFKYPERRELFYGTHPADRIQFSTGRDLRLGPHHLAGPLNYFIYPHVEVGGKRAKLEVQTRFHYRDVQATALHTASSHPTALEPNGR